jgi:hypothetical protein
MNNNLSTYKLLFLIKGILTLCFSLFFVFYALMGAFFASFDGFASTQNSPPFNPGYIFVIIGVIGFVFSITLGTLALIASKYLKEQRHYNFIYVVALVNALTGVLGILLAVFTLIELSKPEVKKLFNR